MANCKVADMMQKQGFFGFASDGNMIFDLVNQTIAPIKLSDRFEIFELSGGKLPYGWAWGMVCWLGQSSGH